MDAIRLEEQRGNDEVTPQLEQVEQVPQGGQVTQGAQDAQVPPRSDPIPNVEEGIGVLEMSNIEALIDIS